MVIIFQSSFVILCSMNYRNSLFDGYRNKLQSRYFYWAYNLQFFTYHIFSNIHLGHLIFCNFKGTFFGKECSLKKIILHIYIYVYIYIYIYIYIFRGCLKEREAYKIISKEGGRLSGRNVQKNMDVYWRKYSNA